MILSKSRVLNQIRSYETNDKRKPFTSEISSITFNKTNRNNEEMLIELKIE